MGEIYAWEKVYQDAFGETDVRNLHERIIAAETILIARGQQISHSAIGNGYELDAGDLDGGRGILLATDAGADEGWLDVVVGCDGARGLLRCERVQFG